MAIEIIPKSKTKKKLALSLVNTAYYGVIALFCVVLIGYALSFILEKNMNDRLEELSILIQEKYNPETRALEQEVLDFDEKLVAFKSIFNSYRKPSKFFSFLNSICHKRVFFSSTNLDIGASQGLFQGNTQSFRTLKEQMLIFNEQELISNTDLTKVSISEQGSIFFNVSFALKTEVFK